jgi:hypothetical protein
MQLSAMPGFFLSPGEGTGAPLPEDLVTMAGHFSDIIQFYEKLSALLPRPSGENPCGECRECCTYLFYLSEYEFQFLDQCLREKTVALSLSFIPLKPSALDPRFACDRWLCPLLRDDGGCHAYEARPLACRLMGPYLPHNSDAISGCIYRNPIVYSTVEEIPLWDEYVRLLRKHPTPPGYFIRKA